MQRKKKKKGGNTQEECFKEGQTDQSKRNSIRRKRRRVQKEKEKYEQTPISCEKQKERRVEDLKGRKYTFKAFSHYCCHSNFLLRLG